MEFGGKRELTFVSTHGSRASWFCGIHMHRDCKGYFVSFLTLEAVEVSQDRKLVCKRYVRTPINLAPARHRLGRGRVRVASAVHALKE